MGQPGDGALARLGGTGLHIRGQPIQVRGQCEKSLAGVIVGKLPRVFPKR